MPTYRVEVKASGPLFDGRAPAYSHDFVNKATQRLQETGADWIRTEAHGFDRSGRGGSGAAAEGLTLSSSGDSRVIFGNMIRGKVWWPWLEGTSKRNSTTRFGGYHTFRSTRRKLADHLQEIVRPLLDELVRKLGG